MIALIIMIIVVATCGASVAENCTYFQSSGGETGKELGMISLLSKPSHTLMFIDIFHIYCLYPPFVGACSLEICPCSSGKRIKQKNKLCFIFLGH